MEIEEDAWHWPLTPIHMWAHCHVWPPTHVIGNTWNKKAKAWDIRDVPKFSDLGLKIRLEKLSGLWLGLGVKTGVVLLPSHWRCSAVLCHPSLHFRNILRESCWLDAMGLIKSGELATFCFTTGQVVLLQIILSQRKGFRHLYAQHPDCLVCQWVKKCSFLLIWEESLLLIGVWVNLMKNNVEWRQPNENCLTCRSPLLWRPRMGTVDTGSRSCLLGRHSGTSWGLQCTVSSPACGWHCPFLGDHLLSHTL